MLIPEAAQRDILIYAFPYALGRRTYAVHTMADAIIQAWPMLSDGDKQLYKREIREAIDEDSAGDEMDVNMWTRVLEQSE